MIKEELKAARKAAYQKAKALRDADPNYQALKLKHKEAARARYRAHADALKAKKKALRLEHIKAKDEELAESSGLTAQLKLLSFD